MSDHAFDAGTRTDPVERLRAGVRDLRVGGAGRFAPDRRALLVLGGTLAPLGIVVVLLGWYGAAHTPYVFEQIPYLISGGLLGLALVFVGSFLYFAHWLTELLREQREQAAALAEAIRAVEAAVARLESAPDRPEPPNRV